MRWPIVWIESGGGPLVLASASLVEHWRGTNASSVSPSLTDYQRACLIDDEVGVVPLRDAEILVLGDEPDRTTLLLEGADLYIVRWRWADTEEQLMSAYDSQRARLSFEKSGVFRTIAGEHCLFDSACAGPGLIESLRTSLASIEYEVCTAHLAPSRSVSAVVHRLREMG